MPARTWVNDITTGDTYIVKEGGARRPVRKGEFTGSNFEELYSIRTVLLTWECIGINWRTWLVVVSVVAIMALITTIVIRRRPHSSI